MIIKIEELSWEASEKTDIINFFWWDILRYIDKTKYCVENILNIELIKSEFNNILTFCEKFKFIFEDFLIKTEEFEKKDFSLYKFLTLKKMFLEILYTNIDLEIEYQDILSWKCEVIFNEWLLRVKSEKWKINHFDFIEMHRWISLWINTFFIVANKIFEDISQWKVSSPISINAEVSDILNDNFINIINELSIKYWVKLKSELIIIEILENEDLQNTMQFKEKIKNLKEIWIKIALDDIETSVEKIRDSIESIIFLWNNVDIIKLDWKTIQSIYKLYKEDKIIFEKIVKEIIIKIKELYQKWIKVVAEWVENLELYNFVKDILWIELFQWFYSKNEGYIKIIKNSNK